MALAEWLDERSSEIAERWAAALRASRSPWSGASVPLLRGFCRAMASLLPGMLSPYRHQIEPLWTECAELFGSVAARWGLSSGEVIEQFHALRELLIRMIFAQPPESFGDDRSLRDLVQLSRALDGGVTQASAGHTDLLFFSAVQGSGVPSPLQPDDLAEVAAQIRLLEAEGRRTMEQLAQAGGA